MLGLDYTLILFCPFNLNVAWEVCEGVAVL